MMEKGGESDSCDVQKGTEQRTDRFPITDEGGDSMDGEKERGRVDGDPGGAGGLRPEYFEIRSVERRSNRFSITTEEEDEDEDKKGEGAQVADGVAFYVDPVIFGE